MRILLVRHGQAVDTHLAPSDQARWLTEEGRATMRGVAEALGELGLRFSRMFTSPLVRAVQTAEILASVGPYDGSLEVVSALAPDEGTTAQALGPLDSLDDHDVVVIVGHEPRIRVLATHLLGVDQFPAFRTGATCLVRWTSGARATFEWMLDPETRVPVRDFKELG
jgi:phosphohistidine phosphatase